MIENIVDYLLSFDTGKMLRVFWVYFVIDFPRYVMTDVFILLDEFIRRLKKRKSQTEQLFEMRTRQKAPLVTVIVPALNEQDTIGWTIRSLREQTYKNLQIIVVDDGSTDATPEICSRLEKAEGISYFRFAERAGKSAVLNYGLRQARGEFVVFVDSDSTFDRDAIMKLVQPFADPKVGAVAGNIIPRNGRKNLLTELQYIEYLFTITVGRQIRAWLGILPVISGAFGGFRRSLIDLKTIGGHEPGPGNDSDLTIRVRKLGYRIAFVHEAVCMTNVPEKMDKLIKQRWRWDRNLIKNRIRKHRDVFNPFSENVRLLDIWSFVDSIFYHVVLAGVTVFYLLDICINFFEMLPFVFLINYILYFVSEAIELLIASLLMRRREMMRSYLYLPLFNPYKIFMKLFRLMGYCQELFFRVSTFDRFAPYKVRQRMIRW